LCEISAGLKNIFLGNLGGVFWGCGQGRILYFFNKQLTNKHFYEQPTESLSSNNSWHKNTRKMPKFKHYLAGFARRTKDYFNGIFNLWVPKNLLFFTLIRSQEKFANFI
jgi:hypothetical protein